MLCFPVQFQFQSPTVKAHVRKTNTLVSQVKLHRDNKSENNIDNTNRTDWLNLLIFFTLLINVQLQVLVKVKVSAKVLFAERKYWQETNILVHTFFFMAPFFSLQGRLCDGRSPLRVSSNVQVNHRSPSHAHKMHTCLPEVSYFCFVLFRLVILA